MIQIEQHRVTGEWREDLLVEELIELLRQLPSDAKVSGGYDGESRYYINNEYVGSIFPWDTGEGFWRVDE